MKKIKVTSNKILAVLFVVFITANAVSVMFKVISDAAENYGTDIKSRIIGSATVIYSSIFDSSVLNVYDKQKYYYIDIYGAAQRVIDNDYIFDAEPENNEVVLESGSLTRVFQKFDEAQLDFMQNNFKELGDFLCSRGTKSLYVQLPSKVSTYENLLPIGVTDYSSQNADITIKIASDCGFDTLDIRENMKNDNIDSSTFFYKTDHHWNTDGMLYGTKILCETLNERYGFNADIAKLDKSNFYETVYENRFLGSDGKRVGRLYAGIDDFTLLEPKLETDMVLRLYKKEFKDGMLERKGSFSDAFIDKSLLTGNLFDVNTYTAYLNGDGANTVLINKNIKDKKILIFRDSYTQLSAPFISLAACHELHLLDLRHYKDSPLNYIEKINPDIVIVMYSPSVIGSDKLFNFSGKEMTDDVSELD